VEGQGLGALGGWGWYVGAYSLSTLDGNSDFTEFPSLVGTKEQSLFMSQIIRLIKKYQVLIQLKLLPSLLLPASGPAVEEEQVE
ncbi:hypothetical protein V4Y02_23830, partial [Escherichia coli]